MNITAAMASLEDMDSDTDDEEYVPDQVISEESGGDDEDVQLPASEGGLPTTSRKRKMAKEGKRKATEGKRKAKGRGNKSTENDEDDNAKEQEGKKEEVKEKARIDDLWASFKKETSSSVSAYKSGQSQQDSPVSGPGPPKKIKIKTSYDFAGEEIIVEKEVTADSKEAKKFLECEDKTSESKDDESVHENKPHPPKSSAPPLVRPKLSSGLSTVLQKIKKKPKMGTLEKTGMDWTKFVQNEGLEEELARNTKDGYLGKQEFLQRADQRQFERERDERLRRYKRFH